MHSMPEFDIDEFAQTVDTAVPTTADLDKMLDRIRKLLAMAEDESLAKEAADSYRAKAFGLMAKYGIDRAMLAASDPASDVVGDHIITVHPPYALDKGILLNAVCLTLGVKAHYKRKERTFHDVHLFGMDSDLRRVDMLFTSLLVQATREISRHPCPPRTSKVTFVKSFFSGYTDQIRRRLEAAEAYARRQAEQQQQQQQRTRHAEPGPSVALVLASRAEKVDQAYRATYPHARAGRPVPRSYIGHSAGEQAGARADLGGTRVTRSAGAIGSSDQR